MKNNIRKKVLVILAILAIIYLTGCSGSDETTTININHNDENIITDSIITSTSDLEATAEVSQSTSDLEATADPRWIIVAVVMLIIAIGWYPLFQYFYYKNCGWRYI